MPSRKRTVEVEVLVDDKDAKKSLKNIEKSVSKTGKAFSDMAKIVGVGITAGAIVDFGKDSVRAFTDLNESVNAVNVTFGESAEGIKELGEEAARSVGLSNAEFNSLAVGFSAFADKIAGSTGQSVVNVMDTLTTRIADFASVMNLEVADAGEKFRSGLAGETEPLRQFGIDVSAAAVNAKALELGLAGSSAQLSEQDKILARYELIMDQTNKTAGDFANTSGELANQMRIAGAEIENAKAIVGESLAPAVVGILPILTKATEGVGVLGIEFGIMAGTIDEATGRLQQYAIQTGQAQGSATLLGGALAELADGFMRVNDEENDITQTTADFTEKALDLIDAAGAAPDELVKLRNGLGELAEQGHFTNEQIEILEGLLNDEIVKGARRGRDAGLSFGRGWKKGGQEATEAIRATTEEMLAQADPAFALVKRTEEFAEAQKRHNEAVQEFGAGSPQAVAAANELLKANGLLNMAQNEFNTVFGPEGVEAIKALGRQAGLYEDDLAGILDFLMRIGSTTRNLPPLPSGGNTHVGGIFHQGGIVGGTPGSTVPILAQAGERVVRNSDVGTSRDPGSSRGGLNVTYHAPAIADPTIFDEFAELARRE